MTTNMLSGERAASAGRDAALVLAAGEEQAAWAARGVHERVGVVRRWRRLLVEHADELAEGVTAAVAARRHVGETLASEVLPLADAMRFVERQGPSLLLGRSLGRRGLPMWLWGVSTQVQRVPWGVVLVIGPGNYPLLLTMAPVVSAIAAGNAAIVKPAPGMTGPLQRLVELGVQAGVARELLPVIGEEKASAESVMDAGVDHVVLTGSVETGRAVLRRCAERVTPATMELSGCDVLVVREDADLDLAARAVAMGLRLNASQTCMAPRRIMVHRMVLGAFRERLLTHVEPLQPAAVSPRVLEQVQSLVDGAERDGAERLCGGVEDGKVRPMVLDRVLPTMAIARADVFAPVCGLIAVRDDEEAIAADAACPYGLTASIFGEPAAARDLGDRLDVGVVQINDLFAPTVDPRAPFGGTRHSGFGVTRGAEGLLAMTRPKVVVARRGTLRPHFDAMTDHDAALVRAYLRMSHGWGWRRRASALRELVAAGRRWWGERSPSGRG